MICGSAAMYHVANWRMDHVTNSAIGKNIVEYWSIFRLRGILKFMMNFHSQQEVILSMPRYVNSVIGTRLVMKAVFTVLVMVVGEFWSFFDSRGSSTGVRIIVSVRSVRVFRSSVASTTFTWICTKVGGS